MDTTTGNYVSFEQGQTLSDAALALGAPESDVVEVHGTDDQIEALSHRVRLGAAEQERRRKRRKQQRQARKRNR